LQLRQNSDGAIAAIRGFRDGVKPGSNAKAALARALFYAPSSSGFSGSPKGGL